MSLPDHIAVVTGEIPTRYATHPHGLALLPIGVTVADIGGPGHRFAGVFLIDPDCTAIAMNDDALEQYLRTNKPVFVHATRPRDLRPFLRRAQQFRRRGFTVEVLP